jgi:hypothetical protein
MSRQTIHDRIMGSKQEPVVISQEADQEDKRTGKGMASGLVLGLIGGMCLTLLSAGLWFYPNLTRAIGLDTPAQAQGQAPAQAQDKADKVVPAAQPQTPFADHARQAGITSCAKAFPALGALLTNGAQYSIQSSWDRTAANDHSIQAIASLKYEGQGFDGNATGVVFASPMGAGCEGNMVRIVPFKRTCDQVAAIFPKGTTRAQDLTGTPLFNLGDSGGQTLLLTTGNGCVAVSIGRYAG